MADPDAVGSGPDSHSAECFHRRRDRVSHRPRSRLPARMRDRGRSGGTRRGRFWHRLLTFESTVSYSEVVVSGPSLLSQPARLTRSDRSVTREREERALIDRLHGGDPTARADLVERFLPLARKLAHSYRGGEDAEDRGRSTAPPRTEGSRDSRAAFPRGSHPIADRGTRRPLPDAGLAHHQPGHRAAPARRREPADHRTTLANGHRTS